MADPVEGKRRRSLRVHLTALAIMITLVPSVAGAVAVAMSLRTAILSDVVDAAKDECVLVTSRFGFQEMPPSEWMMSGGAVCGTFDLQTGPAPLKDVDAPRGTTNLLPEPSRKLVVDTGSGLSLWPFTDPATASFTVSRRLTVENYDPKKTKMTELVLGVNEPFVSGEWVVWTRSSAQEQATLNNAVLWLAGSVLVLVALIGATTWFTVGRALRPVERIRLKVADITAHNLSDRVPVPRSQAEIARLAETMNDTLTRLENAVTERQRFVADASHELRSPIAALRSELEIALAHPEQAQWPQVVSDALADTERIQGLATDLLLLTQLDATALTLDHLVDLTLVVREQGAIREVPDHLTLRYELAPDGVFVRGRPAHLGRLVRNLLDNAERHAQSTITVTATVDGTMAVLEVADDGPGILPADRERIFERFTRLDEARARDTGGTGLGLAIARQIATAHGGTLHAVDAPEGARLVARLPLAPEQ